MREILIIIFIFLLILILTLSIIIYNKNKKINNKSSRIEHLQKVISNIKVEHRIELEEYHLAFLHLKGLFYSMPKSLHNNTIKKSFEIKEDGSVTNTIKVTQTDKSVKRIKQKGSLYYEHLDWKTLISFEDIKLATSTKNPAEFNKMYREYIKDLEDINKKKIK